MSDKITESAAENALNYITGFIKVNQLHPGDSLPGELELAEMIGVGRSSVREALSTLKTLGIIQSKRKGGITITREPVLLELRSYFSEKYYDSELYEDACEFRSIIERGLAEHIFEKTSPATIRLLTDYIESVKERMKAERLYVTDLEKEFHRILTRDCHNRLAATLSYLYAPIFDFAKVFHFKTYHTTTKINQWIETHEELLHHLTEGTKNDFISFMNDHTRRYIRI